MLLVLVWSWNAIDQTEAYLVLPQIREYFIGSVLNAALLRDKLYLARGGSFVVETKLVRFSSSIFSARRDASSGIVIRDSIF